MGFMSLTNCNPLNQTFLVDIQQYRPQTPKISQIKDGGVVKNVPGLMSGCYPPDELSD